MVLLNEGDNRGAKAGCMIRNREVAAGLLSRPL